MQRHTDPIQQRLDYLKRSIKAGPGGASAWGRPGGLLAMSLASAVLQKSRQAEGVQAFHKKVLHDLLAGKENPLASHDKIEWGMWLWSLSVHIEGAKYPRMPKPIIRYAAPLVESLMQHWRQPEPYWKDSRPVGLHAAHVAAVHAGVAQFDRWVKVPHVNRFLAESWQVLHELLQQDEATADRLWSGIPLDVVNPTDKLLLETAGKLEESPDLDLTSRLILAWYWSGVNAVKQAQNHLQEALPMLAEPVEDFGVSTIVHQALAAAAELEFIQAKKRLGIWQVIPHEHAISKEDDRGIKG